MPCDKSTTRQCVPLLSQVEDLELPVKRNQAFVIKYFSKTRDKFCDHLLGEGKKEKDYRWEVLIEVCVPLVLCVHTHYV